MLRQKIHKHINKFCFENRYKQQQINAEIKVRFRKARDLMELSELKLLAKYIDRKYPIDSGSVRGVGRRVSTKVKAWTPRAEILKQACYDPIRHLMK